MSNLANVFRVCYALYRSDDDKQTYLAIVFAVIALGLFAYRFHYRDR